MVHRPHLIERLNEGLNRRLILISAPAGFGKTTLIGEWVASCKQPVAWLSLDDKDKAPARFLIYLISALQTVAPNIGEGVLTALQSPQQPPTDSILIALLNEINDLHNDFVLVLDDYHTVDSKPVDNIIVFLLENLPPQMHLVIATREDPQLPLARYRARSQLMELRVADLRFSFSETADFLNQVMGLKLTEHDIAGLEARTEGWIAGLQMAALSMQGIEDTDSFVQSFTGSHHFVLDYLIEEVLQKQPDNIQAFLLQTCILERMCGAICDAVLHNPSATGQETLEQLERANLFIIPLDNERYWYRYHHLFTELLRNRLTRAYPDQIAELHRRASDWYAENNFTHEAIKHALAIQDWIRAAQAIERFAADELTIRGEISTLLGWLEAVPPKLLLERLKLGLAYAWVLTMANQLDRAEKLLDQLMPLVQTMPSLLGDALAIRVTIAAYRSNMPAVIELAQSALSQVPIEEARSRSRILICLGIAYDETGSDLAAAKHAYREAFELGSVSVSGNKAGGPPPALNSFAHIPEIESLQGNLNVASQMYEQALDLAEQGGGQLSLGVCRVQWGRASLFYEWNDLDGAAGALQESIRVGELWKNPRLLVHSYGTSAMVNQARGQVDEAGVMIHRAEQITHDSYSPLSTLGSLALYQIVWWLAQNDFHSIAQWEQNHNTEWQTQIGRVREHLAIVLARVRIARYYQERDHAALEQALALIKPALERAQTSGLMLNVTRLLILDSLTLYALRETASALTTLKRALTLAEPENYVRSFLDLGKPMEEFLSWGLESQSLTEPHLLVYVNRLLSQFSLGVSVESSQPVNDSLLEPLSQRELEVLRLISLGLSNREICERLFLALSTVKGHNRIIFDKLQVQRRTEAVARARELGLL